MSGNSTGRRRRVVMTIAALILAADASALVAHEVRGTSARSDVAASPSGPSGDARTAAAAIPHSEPVHWASTHAPHGSGITNTTAQSTNWSGYYDSGPTFSEVTADWVVPTVQASQASQYSSTWIGIDGAIDTNSLIQTGTAQDTSAGTTQYFAWYEMLPAAAVPIDLPVSPGDHMQATVVQGVPGTWTITIDDVTAWAGPYSITVPYSTDGDTAEWIEEAPNVDSQQSTLADFGSAQFTGIGVTDSGGPVTQTPVDMLNPAGTSTIATPGSIAGSSFTVNYVGPTPTATAASVNPTSVSSGGLVTYSATVTSSGGTPTGTLTFSVGSTGLCTTILANGSGSCTAANAPAGDDAVTATYAGSSTFFGSIGLANLVVSGSGVAPAHGYWLVGSDGGIFTFGSAQFFGSTGNLRLQRPVVGISPTADLGGYWLVASDGGVFTFGDSGFHGSIPGLGIAPAGSGGAGRKLNAPIVGMVPSSDGGGYFMVASDGGVFAFGDAKFEGSCPGIGGCSGAGVAVMPDATGNGYWLVTATGGVYTFGDAAYYGAPGPQASPVTSAVRTPNGGGYWILLANGTVYGYGDALNLGDPVGSVGGTNPATAIFTTSDGGGYWVAAANGAVWNYGDAPNDGGMAGTKLNGSIIAASGY